MNQNRYIVALFIAYLIPFTLSSQDLRKADSLHRSYRFEEALSLYKNILSNLNDSSAIISIEERITQSENGASLLEYATTPNVVTSKSFHISDFYLHIPELKNLSWMPIPNPLVGKSSHKYYSAIYYPEGSKTLYYSAPDNSESWNIYQTELIGGNLWSEPKLLGEEITSSGDEIFPILSPDGQELYFASNGHYGMGGFDLYVSRFDKESGEWGIPENLGFPYSSTGDDLFFMNTPDGQFSIIGTNRDSAKDSIGLYIVEFSPTPIKKEISDLSEIRAISKLHPQKNAIDTKKKATVEIPQEEGMSEYTKIVHQMRGYKLELDDNFQKQAESRELYVQMTNQEDKALIKETIKKLENEAIAIRTQYDEAAKEVQRVEMDFLAKGIIPTIEESVNNTPNTSEEKQLSYTFAKQSFSEIKNIEIEEIAPQFDYSFKILDKAQFAEDNTLPQSLVYQIQISVTSNKASIKSLKGLSPIFEKRQPSGKYVYTVGLFYSHSEALSCLNQVRKRGFSKAFVVAFNKGKSIPVKDAKVLEKKLSSGAGSSFQVVLRDYPNGLPSTVISAIRECCDKDIAKSAIDGKTLYLVGPFAKKTEADYLVTILKGLGVDNISVEPIKL